MSVLGFGNWKIDSDDAFFCPILKFYMIQIKAGQLFLG